MTGAPTAATRSSAFRAPSRQGGFPTRMMEEAPWRTPARRESVSGYSNTWTNMRHDNALNSGRSGRRQPGEIGGIGPIDSGLARDLAAAAARNPPLHLVRDRHRQPRARHRPWLRPARTGHQPHQALSSVEARARRLDIFWKVIHAAKQADRDRSPVSSVIICDCEHYCWLSCRLDQPCLELAKNYSAGAFGVLDLARCIESSNSNLPQCSLDRLCHFGAQAARTSCAARKRGKQSNSRTSNCACNRLSRSGLRRVPELPRFVWHVTDRAKSHC